jgi:AcrR family transcriptional regulator
MGKRAYHHGDLRRVLVEAAARLVAERGLRGVTLREVGRRAGVSHAAPYHHFADRDALMAAVAEEGFRRFDTAQTAAAAAAGPAPRARLTALGVAYVRFAAAHPHHFRLMFRPELWKPGAYPGLAAVAARTFARLSETVGACRGGEDPQLPALLAWSAIHGLATLWLDGALAGGNPAGTALSQTATWLARGVTEAVAGVAPPAATARTTTPAGRRRPPSARPQPGTPGRPPRRGRRAPGPGQPQR